MLSSTCLSLTLINISHKVGTAPFTISKFGIGLPRTQLDKHNAVFLNTSKLPFEFSISEEVESLFFYL